MYERLTIQSGIEAVRQYRGTFNIEPAVDGLVFAPPAANNYYSDVAIPEGLRKWLVNLRLLRNIPLAYLVPDAALLPPESIRFFNVDQTWVDRVIDGVFAAANTGTVDTVFNASLLAMSRTALDNELAELGMDWSSGNGMTGMLIRSELVRRWPNLIVRAYPKVADNAPDAPQMGVLRAEPISKDIYIAIFGGTPAMVHIREPFTGVRFGVEEAPPGSNTWKVDSHAANGTPLGGQLTVQVRNAANRTLNIAALAADPGAPEHSTRMVAMNLEQKAYVQEFKNTVDEKKGSVPLSNFRGADGRFVTVNLRKGRVMNLQALQDRLTQVQYIDPKEKP